MADLVNIKGTQDGLLVLFDEEAPLAALRESLAKVLKTANGFFDKGNAILDFGRRRVKPDVFVEFCGIIKEESGLLPVAYRSFGETVYPENGEPTEREAEFAFEKESGSTLFIRRTIRSGQRLYYPGNIVILGDVNPGAEVIAGQNIVVLGALRGVAHAGVSGDRATIVAASRLCPTQLRIANRIARAPDGSTGPTEEELARIDADSIVVESL